MTSTPLGDIVAEMLPMRNQKNSLSKFIDLRRKLTGNIEFNLYGGGSKDEGRKALAIRNALDETIYKATSEDIIGGDVRGIDHLKRAITIETLAERMAILEGLSNSARDNGTGIKGEMINLLVDPDRFDRFTPSHQDIMKSAASGSALLARWRFNKIMRDVQDQIQKIVGGR